MEAEFVYKWEPGPPAVGGHSLRIFKERDKESHALVFVGTPAQTARLVRLIPRYRKHTASPRVIERAEGRVAYLDFIGVGDKGRGVGSRLISTLMGLLQEAGVGTLFGHMVQDADSEARWRFFAAHGAEMIAPPGDPPTRGVLFQIRLPGYYMNNYHSKFPSIEEIRKLCVAVKQSIDFSDPDLIDPYDDFDEASVLLTVGADAKGSWNFQTGDPSFTGAAYSYPFWGQAYLSANTNCRDAARKIVEEIKDAAVYDPWEVGS